MERIASFIPIHHKMLKAQAQRIRAKLAKHSEPDKRLYTHLLDSNVRQINQYPEGSPVPWKAINKHLRGAVSHKLKDFVEIGGYWPGHSRRYKVKEEHILEHLEIADRMDTEEYTAHPKVCFETMRVSNRPPKSRTNNSSRHYEPPLIRAAIEVLTRNGYYGNEEAIKSHVKQRRADFEEARHRYDQASPEYQKAAGRYYNDSFCEKAFLDYELIEKSSGVRHCTPAWYAVKTGRLHIVGGGLQSASGDMKRLAYAGIEGIKNYDIESSQPFIATMLLQQARIDAAWLIDYLQTTNYKEVYGKAVGIPGSVFKRIVIAMLMGAQLPHSLKSARYGSYDILDYLAEVSTDEDHLSRLLKRLWEVVGELNSRLKQWHKYLLDTYIPSNTKRGGYLQNAVGKHSALYELSLNHPRKRWKDVSKVVAHILQGMEAACILEMIARSDEANFTPISCEHDGFIVSAGEPDMTLWNEIISGHGLGGMKLVNKEL